MRKCINYSNLRSAHISFCCLQEVGLGEFNDFSSVSVEKDLKIHERSVVLKICNTPFAVLLAGRIKYNNKT